MSKVEGSFMNTSLLRKIGIAAAGLALSAFANAQSSNREPGWEVGMDVVYQDSTKIDFQGGSNISLEDDLGLSFTFGYRFNPYLETKFALDWADVDYRANLARPTGGSAFATGSMESFTPRFDVNLNLMDRAITPYVMAGVGYSFIDTNIPNGRPQTGCYWDPWYGNICTTYQSTKTTESFTYQAGAGLRVDFGSSGSLRLAYERHWIDLTYATGEAAVDQIKLGFIYRY
jgi:opacity protein-like surface antigen